jgi:hypothetical protein
MNEEMHRAMQPHLGDAEKLTTAELHAQLRQFDPKSMQSRVYSYEIVRRRLQPFKRRSRYFIIGIVIALAVFLAGLVFVTSRILEKGRARHMGHDRPSSEARGNIP